MIPDSSTTWPTPALVLLAVLIRTALILLAGLFTLQELLCVVLQAVEFANTCFPP